MDLTRDQLEAYLSRRHGHAVDIIRVQNLGESATGDRDDPKALKVFGYGRPVLVHYRIDSAEESVVLHTAPANQFGHETRADRAAELLLAFDTFNSLPHHVEALDVGIFVPQLAATHTTKQQSWELRSLADGDEFFLVSKYAVGTPYARDLQQLRNGTPLRPRDIRRAQKLALYLSELHAKKFPTSPANGPDSGTRRTNAAGLSQGALYRRRIRDTVGSGEGIMGLLDSYPSDFALVSSEWLEQMEKACVHWRWRLKTRSNRLSQVHGDFHPFNILFSSGNGQDTNDEFALLDRSRGAWGEPADDVSALCINYLFFSLQRTGVLASPFTELWDTFWQTYLDSSGDEKLLDVIAPFMVWRALVLASPVWYNIPDAVRRNLFNLIENILGSQRFYPDQVNQYLTAPDTNHLSGGAQPSHRTAKTTFPAGAIWLTGLPASGKTTIGLHLQRILQDRGFSVVLLDSDAVRSVLTPSPTYTAAERDDFYDRITQLAVELVDQGHLVIIAATANLRCHRQQARTRLSPFAEVWVRCPNQVCRERDPKGLYERAESGEIDNFPGVSAPYEAPDTPEIILDTDEMTAEEAAQIVFAALPFLHHTTR